MHALNIRKALNKAFLKVKPTRDEIDTFKKQLRQLLEGVNPEEHEEFNKNLLADFLKNTAFASDHFINTKRRNDLVIHNEKTAKSPVGVIVEAKRPENTAEMPTPKDLNAKATQELLLYYLRECITGENDKIKHLIVTDVHHWFVFDEQEFYKHFAQDKKLLQDFKEFERGAASGTTTDYFYKQIAQPAIAKAQNELIFTHFDLREYQNILTASGQDQDKKLIPLFKILSPQHLLKLPFANDGNTLNKQFYSELLHIIGLHETGKSKKVIERLPEGKRNPGSLLENTIVQLESTNRLHRLSKRNQYGKTEDEQLEAVALELVITWVNRILFLKLLEAQLLTYHQGDKSYAFLSYERLSEFDEVSALFFQVLAKLPSERTDFNRKDFAKVPYLNSSLFEPTELEEQTVFINALRDKFTLPLHPKTVLTDDKGNTLKGKENTLKYLLEFLDAYDFASEGTEEIQEQQKSIINAAVLGLIFEKINGYKDGSFFTPSFITMYMCRQTLRRAVVQKFNEVKGWKCKTFQDLREDLNDFIKNHPENRGIGRQEANAIINDLKICDPAVGSGHFLVSALNELITIKFDLNILQDEDQQRIDEYTIKIENDELIVERAEDGELFNYQPKNPESQRIQKTLFHEKQTIIENCLFGVDINPNSVKICRLRLWIELLKHAYYRSNPSARLIAVAEDLPPSATTKRLADRSLETLPNIDINIKTGNSLISRFGLDTDLKDVLKKNKSKWTIETYRSAVATYRTAENKEQKRQMIDFINTIKADFKKDIYLNDPKNKQLSKLRGQRMLIENKAEIGDLFEKLAETDIEQDLDKLNQKIEKLEQEIEDIRNSVIYQNAFEWRFEFPEVLSDEGEFIGFDVVMGNPPYLYDKEKQAYFKENYSVFEGRVDLFEVFFERANALLRQEGLLNFIVPNTILSNLYSSKTRLFLQQKTALIEICNFGMDVFDDPTVHVCIILTRREEGAIRKVAIKRQIWQEKHLKAAPDYMILSDELNVSNGTSFDISFSDTERQLFKRLSREKTLDDLCYIRQCIKTGNNDKYTKYSDKPLKEPWKSSLTGKNIDRYQIRNDKLYVKYGDWLARNWKNTDFYEREKIVVRETGNRIIATLDTKNRYVLSSLYAIYFRDEKHEKYLAALLGVLNSRLLSFLVKKISYDLTAGAFTKVRTNQLGKVPLPQHFFEVAPSLEVLVKQILALKKSDPAADTSALESEIDTLVYQLYGLNEEEIKIVEGV